MKKYTKNPKCSTPTVVLLQGILSKLSGQLNNLIVQKNDVIRAKSLKTKKVQPA